MATPENIDHTVDLMEEILGAVLKTLTAIWFSDESVRECSTPHLLVVACAAWLSETGSVMSELQKSADPDCGPILDQAAASIVAHMTKRVRHLQENGQLVPVQVSMEESETVH